MSNCKHYAQKIILSKGWPIDFERVCYEGYDANKCDTCKHYSERTNDRPLVIFEELFPII